MRSAWLWMVVAGCAARDPDAPTGTIAYVGDGGAVHIRDLGGDDLIVTSPRSVKNLTLAHYGDAVAFAGAGDILTTASRTGEVRTFGVAAGNPRVQWGPRDSLRWETARGTEYIPPRGAEPRLLEGAWLATPDPGDDRLVYLRTDGIYVERDDGTDRRRVIACDTTHIQFVGWAQSNQTLVVFDRADAAHLSLVEVASGVHTDRGRSALPLGVGFDYSQAIAPDGEHALVRDGGRLYELAFSSGLLTPILPTGDIAAYTLHGDVVAGDVGLLGFTPDGHARLVLEDAAFVWRVDDGSASIVLHHDEVETTLDTYFNAIYRP